MINLSFWMLLMPLLGFLILGMAGRALSRTAIQTIACGACGLAFLFAVINFFSMLGVPVAERVNDQVLFTWAAVGDFQLGFGLLLDPLAVTMLLVVTGVGLLIHIYSAGYMRDDPSFWRYFSFLNFFIFAMILLVCADNFLFLLVGWGLVGLASFLLIGFWYQRPTAVAAAQKALVINIIGDFGLMIGIFLIFKEYGTLNYMNTSTSFGVFASIDPSTQGHGLQTLIAFFLFLACTAKSAQLPLYMWLPDAMEGPTPVSALIHAATMVTAGVYLLARAHPLFELSPLALLGIGLIGGITAFFAATIALFQLDIKRVLAYSTISQLGYMFMGESAHAYGAGIFHLTTHAYFKALLFLGAGAVIHGLQGEQDMRKMGGLRAKMPITFWTFVVAALAISGMPPFSGFWSKDEILGSLLAEATAGHRPSFYLLWLIGLVTVGLTAFYMFRLIFGIFMGSYRGNEQTGAAAESEEEVGKGKEKGKGEPRPTRAARGRGGRVSIHEAPWIMTVPLIILAVFSLIGGFDGSALASFLAPVFSDVGAPQVSLVVQLISIVLSVALGLLGIWGAWRLYGRGFIYKENPDPLYQLVFHKYYVDEILSAVIINPVVAFARDATRVLEGDALDGGSRGVAWLVRASSAGLRRLQTGYVRNYALAILVGTVLIVLYYVVRG